MTQLQQAIEKIDQINSEDPSKEFYSKHEISKELLYSMRMSDRLETFQADASDELKVAARAQHIGRWKIPRSEYPMDRAGYLRWREELKIMHAAATSDILNSMGFSQEFIARTSFLIKKKQIKSDPESQTLEDVACLVFLEFYFEEFAAKHERDKVIGILQKTWSKMSERGQKAALQLSFSLEDQSLIQEALA